MRTATYHWGGVAALWAAPTIVGDMSFTMGAADSHPSWSAAWRAKQAKVAFYITFLYPLVSKSGILYYVSLSASKQ